MYEIVPGDEFLKQIKKCDSQTRSIIHQKLNNVLTNPIRNKKLFFQGYNLFRIRISDRGRDLRIVYVLEGNLLVIICLGERKDVYKKLKSYMKKAGYRVKEDVAEYSTSIINNSYIPSICYLEPLYYLISLSLLF